MALQQDSETIHRSPASILLLELTEVVSLGYSLESTAVPEGATEGYDGPRFPALDTTSAETMGRISDDMTINRSSTWDRTQFTDSETTTSFFDPSASLTRQNTMLGSDSTPSRSAKGLNAILGNSNAKLKASATLHAEAHSEYSPWLTGVLDFEGSKSQPRVQLDLLLETDTCVHDGYLSGNVILDIRKKSGAKQVIMLSEGKLRLIGFECLTQEKERFIFYQCTSSLSSVVTDLDQIYSSGPDEEGFMLANDGHFEFPFAFHLDPAATSGAPKGRFSPHSGVFVRYIVMASIRIKDPISEAKSIAHFYRNACVWPRLDLATLLVPLPRPIQVTISDAEGTLKVTVTLHRLQWIAGQHCYIKVLVSNNTSKAVKTLAVGLYRDTIIRRPSGSPDGGGRHKTCTRVSKLISESALPFGDRSAKGYASAKGWWTGVLPGESSSFQHSIMLPSGALSVSGKLFEVAYRLKVTISTGTMLSTGLSAEVPVQIVNFISFDPFPELSNVRPQFLNSSTWSNSASARLQSNDLLYVQGTQSLHLPMFNGHEHATMPRPEDSDGIVREVVTSVPLFDPEESELTGHFFADLYYNTFQNNLKQQLTSSPEGSKEQTGLQVHAPSQLCSEMLMQSAESKSASSSPQAIFNLEIEKTSIRPGAVHPLSTQRSKHLPEGNYSPSLHSGNIVRAARFRTLPIPPGPAANASAFEKLRLGTKKHLQGHSDASTTSQSLQEFASSKLHTSLDVSASASLKSPGTVSVKDKIRDLEERVRAIEASKEKYI